MNQDQIAALLSPILARHDLELEALELIPAGKRRLLRIVVDGDGPAGRGPLLDDIADASKAMSFALDESNVTGAAAYTLEVSSRGVSRPLELPRHWRRNVSRLVEVTTSTGDKFTGRIVSASEDHVQLDVLGETHTLALAEVAKALVQVELNRPAADDPTPEEDPASQEPVSESTTPMNESSD
jgi:ribosome maturation factor RimP